MGTNIVVEVKYVSMFEPWQSTKIINLRYSFDGEATIPESNIEIVVFLFLLKIR
jgi:hypothetical protein